MWLKELKIENYRSIKSAHISFKNRSEIFTFLGANNSGKSNIATAISMLMEILNSNEPKFTKSDWHNFDDNLELKLSFTFNLDNDDINFVQEELGLQIREKNKDFFGTTLDITIIGRGKFPSNLSIKFGKLVFNDRQLYIGTPPHAASSEFFWSQLIEKHNSSNDGVIDVIDGIFPRAARQYGIKVHESGVSFKQIVSALINNNIVIFPEFRRRPDNNPQHVTRSPSGINLSSALFNIKNGNKDQRATFEKIKKVFNEVHPTLKLEVRTANNKHEIVIEKDGLEFEIYNIGSGILQIINFLTHIIGVKNSIFVVDEPEHHLSAHTKRILKREITAAKENQFVIITHSTDFVNLEELFRNIIVKNTNGVSRFISIPEIEFTEKELRILSKKINYENKELFFCDKVLLVEGESEKYVYLTAAEKHYSFDVNGVSIVSVDGDGFRLLARFLNKLEIPFLLTADLNKELQVSELIADDLVKHAYILGKDDILECFEKSDLDAAKKLYISKPLQAKFIMDKITDEKRATPKEILNVVDKLKTI